MTDWFVGEKHIQWQVADKWLIRWSDQSIWKNVFGVCCQGEGHNVLSEKCPKNWVVI